MALITVEWSNEADKSLEGIFDYYNRKAGFKTARKIINKIYSRTVILIANPQAGRREEMLIGRSQEFRYLVEGHYKIIYRYEPGKVVISTVFDSRRNPQELKEEVI